MLNIPPIITRLYWLATLLLFGAAVTVTFFFTPVEATMGAVQKIFYLHLPVAICTFLACMVNFAASVGYLWQRRQKWDDLAAAAAGVAVLLCSIVLMSGMFWGKAAWGQWWTWSPRLTFSLLLWLLYAVYMIIRPSIESAPRRALISAVYGVVAFLDVPLVWLSVRLLPDIHPTSVSLEPAMQRTLALFFVPVIMLTFGLIAARYMLSRRLAATQAEQDEQADAAADLADARTLRTRWTPHPGGAP